MMITYAIEFLLGACASHVVKKLTLCIDSKADEVEEFFHVIDVAQFVAVAVVGGLEEVVNISADIGERWSEDGCASEVGS